MKFLIPSSIQKPKNINLILRQSGYHPEVKRISGELSFVRSATGRPFPRFHVYVDEVVEGWMVNLHLDQKQPTYEGSSAHNGEYEGPIIEEEARRIKWAGR